MSQFKARLTVVLKADDVVVAESENSVLWQQVLSAINGGAMETPSPSPPPISTAATNLIPVVTSNKSGMALQQFATKVGASLDAVVGACDPKTSEPLLHLDMHAWSAVKQQLPERGSRALSPIAVAGTLLVVWCKEAGLATPTQSQAQKVLATIDLNDKNPSRGIRSSPWLQARHGGQIVLNPAQIQKALLLVKCFCTQDWKAWNSSEE